MRRVGKLIADGTLSSEIDTAYPLESFRAALAASVKPGRGGKVMLRFD